MTDLLIIAVPVITAFTQLLKKIEAVPVSSNNAKLTAFIASLLIVLGLSYNSGQLSIDPVSVAQYSVSTFTLFLLSVGLYETCKSLINKVK